MLEIRNARADAPARGGGQGGPSAAPVVEDG
jgi:hypothetical protein